MNMYARRLEELGIDFEIAGSDAFADNGEIGEVMNLLRALDDADDPVATVAVLRGLFFGLSDRELLEHRAGRRALLLCRSGLRRARHGAGAAGVRDSPRTGGRRRPGARLRRPWKRSCSGRASQPPSDGGDGRQPGRQRPQARRDPARSRERGHDLVRRRRRVHGRVGRRPAGRGDEPHARPARRGQPDEPPQSQGPRSPVVWLANPAGVGDFEPDKHVRRTAGRPRGHFRFTRTFGVHGPKTVSQPLGLGEERGGGEKIRVGGGETG